MPYGKDRETAVFRGDRLSGPIVQIGTWVPREEIPSPCATAEVLEGFDESATRATRGGYRLLG